MTKTEKNEKLSSEDGKWLANDGVDNKEFYGECNRVYKLSKEIVSRLQKILIRVKNYCRVDEDFVASIDSMASIILGMRKISSFRIGSGANELENVRISLWKGRLCVEKLAIAKLASDLVVELMDSSLTESVLRMALLYNEILLLNLPVDFSSVNVYGNTCPMLLHPLRKFSATRILQAVAAKRAEKCSYNLVSGLLNHYFAVDEEEEVEEHGSVTVSQEIEGEINNRNLEAEKDAENQTLPVSRNSASSNTSVEIYRALTKHLGKEAKENKSALYHCLEVFWREEEKHARGILALSVRAASQLLEDNVVRSANAFGKSRPKSTAKSKLINYYQQVLWGEVGGYLDHILLWWSLDPLGGYPPSMSQSFRNYIIEIKSAGLIPVHVMPAITSLLDAMCCHLTSTSWDQLFRKNLVSADTVKRNFYKDYDIEGSAAGQFFVEMLADLIKLNNSCEDPVLNLEELPLVEQIPILHRLDHSIHTVRMWMSSRCRDLAGKWDLDGFYRTSHTDISKCLQTLNSLQLTNHVAIAASTSVQVAVCTKMRAKLISEIRENVEKLKKTANESIDVLAKDCRTECLAILHMCFPAPAHWSRVGPLPDSPSPFVEKYLDSILGPVFEATRRMPPDIRMSSGAMILRILCESWLEYMYLHRIKFSESGAYQLLTDFGAISKWLLEKVELPKDLLNSLISHEVLRRCEGVGRLLLRQRGESIKMTTNSSVCNDSSSCGKGSTADYMPAEMYVPNQEQWLELRAPVKANICCRET